MNLVRTSPYNWLSALCMVGSVWVVYSLTVATQSGPTLCMVKRITGYPCPSCGTTRSVMNILQGNLADGVLLNPLGLVVTFLMFVVPVWIVYDIVYAKKTLRGVYQNFEKSIRKPRVAFPILIFIILNWIWNIYKNL